jgi:hypothetical protein
MQFSLKVITLINSNIINKQTEEVMLNAILFVVLLFISPLFAQGDEGGEKVMEYYFYADSEEDITIRDGSDQHPYKYLKELPPVSGSVKLYFFSADASYQYDPDGPYENILTLVNCDRIWIERYGNGTVMFGDSENPYENGIVINPSCNYIKITGIDFGGFTHNSLYIEGSPGNIISDVNIIDCNFLTNIETNGDTVTNCAAIRINYARDVSITGCNITQGNQDAQVDGIFVQHTEGFYMRDNTVILEHNGYIQQHLDCLQMNSDCSDVTIENNYFENASTSTDGNRQGIYITGTKGEIKIANNVIVSGRGRGLINMTIYGDTDVLKIFNNTLVGRGNPGHLARIVCQDISNTAVLNIKNNIFYREGNGTSAYAQTLVFE